MPWNASISHCTLCTGWRYHFHLATVEASFFTRHILQSIACMVLTVVHTVWTIQAIQVQRDACTRVAIAHIWNLSWVVAASTPLTAYGITGCSDTFCDPNEILDHDGNVFCGFNGVPATAWSPRDLKQLLKTHARSGAPWHEPGFHSGYNEIILNSVMHNRNLPHAVAGFFFPRGENPVTDDLGYSIIIDVVEVHQAFLSEYGITAAEVPLVEFDPSNWDAPFSLYVS